MTANLSPTPGDTDVLRRYLLGRLSPEAREGVEARIFSNDQLFWDRLCLEEDQLIDEYALDLLDDATRADVEQHFLCVGQRQTKLDFVNALREHVQRDGARQERSAWDWLRIPVGVPRWALAAAAALVLVLPPAVWQVSERLAQRNVDAWLSAELVRAGGELARVRLPERCGSVSLHLDPGPVPYPDFRASLHEVTGEELWAQGQLKAVNADGRATVTVTVPCGLLPEGDFHLRLYGMSSGSAPARLHRYDFRVLRD